MSDKMVTFHDTTLRDGVQSLWGMKLSCGIIDAVASEMDQAGLASIETFGMGHWVPWVRFFKEDPVAAMALFEKKLQKTPMVCTPTLGIHLNSFTVASPMPMVRYYYQTMFDLYKGKWRNTFMISNTRDELLHDYPKLLPIYKELGIELTPYVTYTVSPRHTDEYYADHIRKLQKFKPPRICLKDVGGLLTVERAKTLIPVFKREAMGLPLMIHTHGMSGNNEAVVVEAMKQGIREIQTCIPPLSNGSSHPNIFNVIHNAKVLGLETNINEESLRVVEERLTRIAKLEGLPIGAPLLYDERVYKHKIPGGVISVLKEQLGQLGIAHKLDEVLEEIPRITAELGHPVMITPHSQFIVSQAAVNVAVGERWKEVLDSMIEFALGMYGVEDAGVPYMDPNIKDMLLSHPNAKRIAEKWDRDQEEAEKEVPLKDIKKKYGMENASDEEFWANFYQISDELKKLRVSGGAPKTYYTGKEPLVMLLKELSKDVDIRRLQLQKGNSFFEFRRSHG
jgi:oxaloacetate decarboxylase (Na+ extruding) subunit alpha